MPHRDLERILSQFRVPDDGSFRLDQVDPRWSGDPDVPREERKELAKSILSEDVSKLAEMQDLLYAADQWSVLAIFQAMDAAGKDGTIKHVMSGVNPQGCQVFSFKQPSAEELDHNFLWRYTRAMPERGRIGIFNRSYYEEVLVVRVHPEWIAKQRIPGADPSSKRFWKDRYHDINEMEHHLTRNGTAVVKFFLHVSKDEQRSRFLKRLREPDKYWKFAAADLSERGFWDQYMEAYESMLNATSTAWAPWYVIPADHKWATRALVSTVLSRTIRKLKLSYPEVSPANKAQIDEARRQLEAEEAKD